jgi:hypothetical protein
MKTPLLGAAYVARSVNAADNRMVNLFPEVIPEGGKERGWLQRTPGLRRVLTAGTGPIRGLWSFGEYAYAVSGTKLYRITTAGVATEVGDITGTGPVSMADNGTQLFVAANPDGFIYNASNGVFAQVTDPDFPGAKVVGYLDGYFVFIEPNSQRVWVTDLLDGQAVDPLDFASAEGSPDGLVSMIVDHREVWLFGAESTEVWVNSGNADFPLERINGAFNEVGCAATYSVAKADNSVFWLGADDRGRGIVYRANGYTAVRVSTHAVEWQIQTYGDISGAIGYTYQQDGHTFYVLTFPSSGVTWAFDVGTNAWHERRGFYNGSFTRHRAASQTAFNSEVWVGDYEDGRIYAFDLNVYEDDDRPQKWLRSWRALPAGTNTLKRTAQHMLQVDCESGVGLSGIDTSVQLVDIELLTEGGDEILTEVFGLDQWVAISVPSPGVFTYVAANGSRAVAIRAELAVYTTDDYGDNWTLRQALPAALGAPSVNFGGGLWVAPSRTSTQVFTSVDNAVTWQTRTMPATRSWFYHAYGNGVHVITARSSTDNATSTDAVTWTLRTGYPAADNLTGLKFGNGVFVSISSNTHAAWSTNGVTWNAVTLPSTNVTSLDYGNGLFIAAIGSFGNQYMTSPDGQVWTLRGLPISDTWRSVCFGEALWTMLASVRSLVSPDGYTWVEKSTAINRSWLSAAFVTPYFIAMHSGGQTDGQRYRVPLTGGDQPLLIDQKQTQGVIPKVMLRWSDDGGHTWSNEHWREVGRQGEYGTRVIWRRLGMTLKLRDRVFELSGTDPVKIALMGAELDVSPTRG